MIVPNLEIFDSKGVTGGTLYGTWYKVSNFSALSIHFMGLEAASTTWVEVSNNPENDPNYAPPPSPPDANPGVPIVYITTGSMSPPTEDVNAMQDVAYSQDGTQAMWSPACLVWNYIRVCKAVTGTPADVTTANLFGQVVA
jgi:hypothetical protein